MVGILTGQWECFLNSENGPLQLPTYLVVVASFLNQSLGTFSHMAPMIQCTMSSFVVRSNYGKKKRVSIGQEFQMVGVGLCIYYSFFSLYIVGS